MTGLFCWRDGVVFSLLLAAGGFSLAAGRSYFDAVIPLAIEAGAPRQLARDLVGRDLRALPQDDRWRVDHFLTSLTGDWIGEHQGGLEPVLLGSLVRGRTRWLLVTLRRPSDATLYQFDADWRLVTSTSIRRPWHGALFFLGDIELVSTPVSTLVRMDAVICDDEMDCDEPQRALLGIDDDGAYLLRVEDETGGQATTGRSWIWVDSDHPGFTPSTWQRALLGDDPQHVLLALRRYPGSNPRGTEGEVQVWREVVGSPVTQRRLRELAVSPYPWLRAAAERCLGRGK